MAKKNSVDELQKQYDDLAAACSALAPTLSAAVRSRIQQGGQVKLDDDAKRFKELMSLKLTAQQELQAAKEAQQAGRRKQLDDARRLLEDAGEITPRAETHSPEERVVEVL
jgi:exonuclease VII small subunit